MKFVFMVAFPILVSAQPWSTFPDPSRAIDWTSGIGFPIPNYTANCATQPVLTANSVTADAANTTAIQNALASCDTTHNVVNIPAGTYYVAGITYGTQGRQVIRGAGPNATTIYLTGFAPCLGLNLGICMLAAGGQFGGSGAVQPGGAQACSWTGGYAKGTTSITLNSCGGAPPVNQILILDQANDASDSGGVFICDTTWDAANGAASYPNPATTVGCTISFYDQGNINHNGRVINGTTHSEQQIVYMTAVTGTGTGPYTVTISPGVSFTNIRSGQSPGAWWPGILTNTGIENLTVIHSYFFLVVSSATGFVAGNYVKGVTSGSTAYITAVDTGKNYLYLSAQQGGEFATSETIQQTATRGGPPTGVQTTNSTSTNQFANNTAIALFACYQCWVRNVRSEYAGRDHVIIYESYESVIRDSYFYQAQAHGSQSYGIEVNVGSGVLIENNVFQQVTNPVLFGQASGSVVGYNYGVFAGFQNADGTPNAYAVAADNGHNAGNGMNLWEGNNFQSIWSDDSWGSNAIATYFRNMLLGWQNGKTRSTFPIPLRSWNRGFSAVGNVLGQPGYAVNYESYATSSSGGVNGGDAPGSVSIYSLGWSGNADVAACTLPPVCDPLVRSTLMRWGNYDVVTSGVNWNSTEASPAAVPYINANFTTSYFDSLPHTLPASLYYTSTPSWWPTVKAWPPVGPDISSGNLGTCSGTYSGAQAVSSSQCTGGTLSSAWANHATSIPAHDCYLNVMGGPPDGTGPVLAFDANICYYGAPVSSTGRATSGGLFSGGIH